MIFRLKEPRKNNPNYGWPLLLLAYGVAYDERYVWDQTALSGLWIISGRCSQGVALGWLDSPLWGRGIVNSELKTEDCKFVIGEQARRWGGAARQGLALPGGNRVGARSRRVGTLPGMRGGEGVVGEDLAGVGLEPSGDFGEEGSAVFG